MRAVFWTIGYDTIYALQDVRDDAIVGIGSTARLFGRHVRRGRLALHGLRGLRGGGGARRRGRDFRAGRRAGFALHLGWQVLNLRGGGAAGGVDALTLFRSNRDAGLILFAGFLLAALARTMF